MNNRAIISKVEIITRGYRKILNKNELKGFCDKRVQMNVTIVRPASSCRVVLNRSSPIRNEVALNEAIARSVQKHEVKSNVRFFQTYMFEHVRFISLYFFMNS